MQSITASIIQSSAIGRPSYVVNAADLRAVFVGNLILKYADDTYPIIPAVDLQNVEEWSQINNLKLNHTKTQKIIITDSKGNRTNLHSRRSRCHKE